MNQRAKDLAQRLKAFNDQVIAFVKNIGDEDWHKVCTWEEWTVGVTARHIGTGHYRIIGLAKMFINGEELPELTAEQVNESGNKHARKHADCNREEVLEVLQKYGSSLSDFVTGLDDAELDCKGHLSLAGGEITTQQLLEYVILQSGGEHLANMKAATKL
jgi:uncharacterized damage-inducible protein DinB